MRSPADFAPAFLAALFLGGLPLRGADQAATSQIIERYEQMVERAPMAGESFDRLVQEYQRGAGLDQLDRQWAQLAAAPGANAANFEILRGLLADLAGRADDARLQLEAATKAQPDDYRGWLALGDCAVHQGQWAAAIDSYRKGVATKVAGEDRLALFRKLGQTQERSLDLEGGLATWRQMVAEFPNDRYAVEEAGNAELDASQFDDGRLTFQKLVDLAEPDSMNRVQALMLLAEVDDRQGRAAAAVAGYEKILPLTAEGSWINRELRRSSRFSGATTISPGSPATTAAGSRPTPRMWTRSSSSAASSPSWDKNPRRSTPCARRRNSPPIAMRCARLWASA
jgi:tetratricopeptide (TPR) repeat protein